MNLAKIKNLTKILTYSLELLKMIRTWQMKPKKRQKKPRLATRQRGKSSIDSNIIRKTETKRSNKTESTDKQTRKKSKRKIEDTTKTTMKRDNSIERSTENRTKKKYDKKTENTTKKFKQIQ